MKTTTEQAYQDILEALAQATPRPLSASCDAWLRDWVENGSGKDHVPRSQFIESEEGAEGVLALCDTIAAAAGPFLTEASRLARIVSHGKHGKEITPTMLHALASVMGYSYTWGCNDDLKPEIEPELSAEAVEAKVIA